MRHLSRTALHLSLFIFMLGTLAACGFVGGTRLGDDINQPFREGDSGFVVCSEGCRNQGQCGVTTNNDTDVDIVLVNPGRPATRNHTAIVQANEPVTILELNQPTMVREISGERFPMNFYRIDYDPPSGTQVAGWVHGMCIANRAQN